MDELSKISKLIFAYLKQNYVYSIIVLYFIFGSVLYVFLSIDIMLPCIWKSIFNVECPACGITRASISLLQFDFRTAYEFNPLVFIVVPALTFYIISDFLKFSKLYSDKTK